MTKSTMDTKLPRKLEQKMQIVENRSGWLDCAEISVLLRLPNGPLVHLLQGAPTVAIGIYLRVLYALQLDDDNSSAREGRCDGEGVAGFEP